ncbi:hypothetical protein V1519DRAFT_446293 [Lipomyces tetrasporus]
MDSEDVTYLLLTCLTCPSLAGVAQARQSFCNSSVRIYASSICYSWVRRPVATFSRLITPRFYCLHSPCKYTNYLLTATHWTQMTTMATL